MRFRFLTLALIAALFGAVAVAPHSADAKPDVSALSQKVSGTWTEEATGGSGAFKGTLTITEFEQRGDDLWALGAIDGNAKKFGKFTDTFASQVVGASVDGGDAAAAGGRAMLQNAPCQILFLELGPIFLNVLGLVIEVPDPIVIDIRAEPGLLLGDLLCAIANLLDGGSPLGFLADLLNQLLDALLG